MHVILPNVHYTQAYVVCGLADRATAEMDRTRETCGILDEEMVSCEIGWQFGIQT